MSRPADQPAAPGGSARSSTADRRRELTAAVLGAAAAGGLALVAAGQRWAEVTADRQPPLPPVSAVLSGSAAAPLVPATGLLLLAAAVVLVAVRGPARVGVGALVAAAGGALGWSGAGALAGRVDAGAADLPVLDDAMAGARVDLSVTGPVVVLVAGVLAVAVGALVVVRGRGWPAMGRRYQRPGDPAAAARTGEQRADDAWRALDRGEDPTEDAAEDPAEHPTSPPGRAARG
ncbi:Trp biosynthesis-associated membrane protein [Geodermatophilus sp. SYSU D00815]